MMIIITSTTTATTSSIELGVIDTYCAPYIRFRNFVIYIERDSTSNYFDLFKMMANHYEMCVCASVYWLYIKATPHACQTTHKEIQSESFENVLKHSTFSSLGNPCGRIVTSFVSSKYVLKWRTYNVPLGFDFITFTSLKIVTMLLKLEEENMNLMSERIFSATATQPASTIILFFLFTIPIFNRAYSTSTLCLRIC